MSDHLITLVADDAHQHTHRLVRTNRYHRQMLDAYQRGATAIGVDMIKDLALRHGHIPEDTFQKFLDAGLPERVLILNDLEIWWQLYLFTVTKGDPGFEWEMVEEWPIHIGGYGMVDGM